MKKISIILMSIMISMLMFSPVFAYPSMIIFVDDNLINDVSAKKVDC